MSNQQVKPSGNLVTPTNKVDMGGSELDIIYNPSLSPEFVLAIKQRVTAVMSSADESSHQYQPSDIMEEFKHLDEDFKGVTERDVEVLKAINECYDYIEI